MATIYNIPLEVPTKQTTNQNQPQKYLEAREVSEPGPGARVSSLTQQEVAQTNFGIKSPEFPALEEFKKAAQRCKEQQKLLAQTIEKGPSRVPSSRRDKPLTAEDLSSKQSPYIDSREGPPEMIKSSSRDTKTATFQNVGAPSKESKEPSREDQNLEEAMQQYTNSGYSGDSKKAPHFVSYNDLRSTPTLGANNPVSSSVESLNSKINSIRKGLENPRINLQNLKNSAKQTPSDPQTQIGSHLESAAASKHDDLPLQGSREQLGQPSDRVAEQPIESFRYQPHLVSQYAQNYFKQQEQLRASSRHSKEEEGGGFTSKYAQMKTAESRNDDRRGIHSTADMATSDHSTTMGSRGKYPRADKSPSLTRAQKILDQNQRLVKQSTSHVEHVMMREARRQMDSSYHLPLRDRSGSSNSRSKPLQFNEITSNMDSMEKNRSQKRHMNILETNSEDYSRDQRQSEDPSFAMPLRQDPQQQPLRQEQQQLPQQQPQQPVPNKYAYLPPSRHSQERPAPHLSTIPNRSRDQPDLRPSSGLAKSETEKHLKRAADVVDLRTKNEYPQTMSNSGIKPPLRIKEEEEPVGKALLMNSTLLSNTSMDPSLIPNLRNQLQFQCQCISRLEAEKKELQFLLEKENGAVKSLIEKQGQTIEHYEEQIRTLNHSVSFYQHRIEDMMSKHTQEMKRQNADSLEEVELQRKQLEDEMSSMSRKHLEIELTQKNYIDELERDRCLDKQKIQDLQKELEDARKDVELLERRLDKQVLVDQDIERELQEKIIELTEELSRQREEVQVINQEYDALEDENLRLRKQYQAKTDKNQMLEKIVYGKRSTSTSHQTGAVRSAVFAQLPPAKPLKERKNRRNAP